MNATETSVIPESAVFVVDDDVQVRTSLSQLFGSIGLNAELFASANEFLDRYEPNRPGCLVLDVRMPGMDGFGLQAELRKAEIDIPIIFLTAFAEVRLAVDAMKSGARDFIEKPYSAQDLLRAVTSAIEKDRADRTRRAGRVRTRELVDQLTARERQIADLLLQGHSAKSVARELSLSSKTVDFHRRNLFKKMDVTNIVELMRLIGPERG